MKIKIAIVLLFLTVSAYPSATALESTEPPLADAGLDQEVARETTVLLDGTGSHDPDGEIERYEWSIETPSGDESTPAQKSEPRTRFEATEVGRYTVTLTVTDNDRVSNTDTLYVTVTPGERPDITIDGARQYRVGDTGQFTATITAGAANLSRVAWYVDEKTVSNSSLSGTEATDLIEQPFVESGTQTIGATVYDDDGQQRSSSITVSIDEQRQPSSDIAAHASPTLDGPHLITGSKPLQGTYHLDTSVSRAKITRVAWTDGTTTYGNGMTETINWAPGDHQLYAVVRYIDGSRDVALFADGETGIVADPKPDIDIGEIDRHGGIRGEPAASDSYGNLKEVTVEIADETVASSTVDPLERRHLDGTRVRTPFSASNISFGEEHEIAVIATDLRGQTTTETAIVTPVGEPEIVRSEFVNDPVDSYHEQLDPERYAAHHVLEVDLKGVDPENVEINLQRTNIEDTREINSELYHRQELLNKVDGVLTVHSYWTGDILGEYRINIRSRISEYNGEDSPINVETSTFAVVPSDPELRYEVISEGTGHQKTDWGMVVDASDSFDPDGTELSYIWGGGANPIVPDNSTAKFSSVEFASLTIEDGFERKTRNTYSYLDYFNPGIERARPDDDRAYKPGETVRIRVLTKPYKFSKNRYTVDLGLHIEDISGTITTWRKVDVEGGTCNVDACWFPEGTEYLDIDNRRYRYYEGYIEAEASEFSNGATNPEVTVYNKDGDERMEVSSRIDDVNVLTKGSQVWENVSVSELEYTIEKPIRKYVTTQSEAALDQYLDEGYTVVRKTTGTEYTLEKYVQTQEAKYETQTRSFSRSSMRRVFLEANPDWKSAGTETKTKTRTRTKTEWRDSKSGKGEFTGETRRIEASPAEYRTERQYEYDYEVEKTERRIVERTKRVRVRKTGTKTVTNCNRFRCYRTTEPYSYWTTEKRTYLATEAYTDTVTKTGTYWARGKRGYDHQSTGNTRRVKVADAGYTTQYEFQYDVEETETVWRYEATREVQTQEEQYEWRERKTTKNQAAAKQLARLSDEWRVGDTSVTPKWTLSKYMGTETRTVSSYTDPDHVIETRAVVSADVKQRYIDTDTGETILEPINHTTEEYSADSAMSEEDILREFEREKGDDSTEDSFQWCKIKQRC